MSAEAGASGRPEADREQGDLANGRGRTEWDDHVPLPTGKPLRVLVLTAHPDAGGPLPKLAPLLLNGLCRAGAQVLELGWSSRSSGAEPLLQKLVDRFADLTRVLLCVRRCRPDVIYVATSHDWKTLARDMALALTLTRHGPPFVLHIHGSACERFGQPGQTLFTRCSVWLMRRAAAVLLLSSEELEPWHRYCPEGRFEVVLNPFKPAFSERGAHGSAGRGTSVPTALFVGRLMRDKGVFDLVTAIALVSRVVPCRLVMAGTGPARVALEQLIADRGLGDTVDLAGYLTGSRLDKAYAAADVFVLPSYREGFPLSVMEAMGHGLPVVTTPIRGCAEFLSPDEHALFVPAGDPQELSEAIRRLFQDRGLRERMGSANLRKVAEFAPDEVVPRYIEILRSVVGTGRGVPGSNGRGHREVR